MVNDKEKKHSPTYLVDADLPLGFLMAKIQRLQTARRERRSELF